VCLLVVGSMTVAQAIQCQMIMYSKGYGRKESCPNLKYHPGIYLDSVWETTKNSHRIVGLQDKISVRDIMNTKQLANCLTLASYSTYPQNKKQSLPGRVSPLWHWLGG
jgi:hypothetical protein